VARDRESTEVKIKAKPFWAKLLKKLIMVLPLIVLPFNMWLNSLKNYNPPP
jgi:hypothetical protein